MLDDSEVSVRSGREVNEGVFRTIGSHGGGLNRKLLQIIKQDAVFRNVEVYVV